jgi:uncharacterized membrane protein
VWRAIAWSAIILCALLAHFLDSSAGRDVCVLAVLGLLAAGVPRALRIPLLVIIVIALTAIVCGYSDKLLDAIPAVIAALIAWIFARTLFRGRTPLIGRAIAAMDGAEQLQDPATARYARRLTAFWATYQGALAAAAFGLALHSWAAATWLPFLPGPRTFGAIGLPLAVVALLAVEFALRSRLLPRAPPRHAIAFACALVRVWPQLLKD